MVAGYNQRMSDTQTPVNFWMQYGSELIIGTVGIVAPLIAFFTARFKSKYDREKERSGMRREKLEHFFHKLQSIQENVHNHLDDDHVNNSHENLTKKIEGALPSLKPEGYLYFGLKDKLDPYITETRILARITNERRRQKEINKNSKEFHEISKQFFSIAEKQTKFFNALQDAVTIIGKKEIR